MKQVALFCMFLVVSTVSHARDDVGDYPVAEALNNSALGSNISFYFGDTKHPDIVKNYGEFRTNKKTNAFNKTDTEACNWAFLSAMKALRDRALKEGGNAVVNIRSNYKNNTTSSEENFKCGAGKFVAGVALVGSVVTIK